MYKVEQIKNDGIIFSQNGKKYFLEKYYIAENWIRYGGSFIKKIGEALHNADLLNTKKILVNWKYDIDIDFILKMDDTKVVEYKELPKIISS